MVKITLSEYQEKLTGIWLEYSLVDFSLTVLYARAWSTQGFDCLDSGSVSIVKLCNLEWELCWKGCVKKKKNALRSRDLSASARAALKSKLLPLFLLSWPCLAVHFTDLDQTLTLCFLAWPQEYLVNMDGLAPLASPQLLSAGWSSLTEELLHTDTLFSIHNSTSQVMLLKLLSVTQFCAAHWTWS